MDDMDRAQKLRQMSIGQLVKRISASTLDRDFMGLPETGEIWVRTPENLKDYLAHVLHELREPWRLRCMPSGGRKDDTAYFNIWMKKRDRDFPELRPGYTPPEGGDDDGGDDGAPPPPVV
ncbi:hypothetical protein [Roseibium alexandrii]|uniref:Uncharacterized protein n=1 Tax=Roseibium alexandrii TaxID=388408 RepID=A0A0M7ARP1_9HYPH|nr:hypothetical protein [Roseibium alexandrii]CTQ77569.1 hypothetical protein LAX5112_04956 [Roseibium alexandrii]